MTVGIGGSLRVHLLDVLRADGTAYFWASHEGKFTSALDGAAHDYLPWIKEPYPTIRFTRSTAADGGDLHLQNLSGNTIDREVAALLRAYEFDRAYCIYRPWLVPRDLAEFEMHGFPREEVVNNEEVSFRFNQLFQPNELPAYDFLQTRECHFRYRSAPCGMRRGTLFVPLTTANVHTASTIGRSDLALEPNLYSGEKVMILIGTGAGQEGFIASHTATTFTMTANWSVTPDATSQFIVTGPGTMKVSPQLADIFSSTTIGKSGLGRTTNEDQNELVVIIAGTGAGQERLIASNTTTTYTVSPAWTVTPDGTSRFIVVYRSCPKDRASCVTRGVIERFPGIIHLQPKLVQVSTPQSTPNSGVAPTGARRGWSYDQAHGTGGSSRERDEEAGIRWGRDF